MNILHLSAECYPVAKVGGLGDVVGALPKYQNKLGIYASVVLPFYDRKFTQENALEQVYLGSAELGQKTFDFEVLKETHDVLGFPLYLIKIPGLLDRSEVYSYPDETEQFVAYQIAVLEWVIKTNFKVDVFHCHDHHSGLVPFLIQHSRKFNALTRVASVCTIHNGQYQGWMGWNKFYYLPEVDLSQTGLLDWGGCINPLAAAVKCCWAYTTVSPSYLEELKVNSNGLEFLFELEQHKGIGIINGIDTDVWDPATDAMIVSNYNQTNIKLGKEANKIAICEEFNLDAKKPLVTFIGRMVLEKGADKLAELIEECLSQFKNEVSFLILGSGDKVIEEEINNLKLADCAVVIGYNEALSHRIYASADFILMPSRVEPCGLNQLYALKYGTVPIVRSTGGLKDSVIDFDEENGYGIRFEELELTQMIQAVKRAIDLFKNQKKLNQLRQLMMGLDFSWDQSAQQYINLYANLISKKNDSI
ncbi:glycogen synthase [Pedobacter cryophilus]|uniref:Glycogen synthase n=1 Tax=Pedobacter cryophilus TaxID=2571271 RepID=A0A4U1C4V8_9SPHI|nr:glycogen/starch synthase [Pedobacter cryophilus]TKC00900.1 glycogen synthase [Pedobacter cryophilus]